jgi:hypothetical protein
MTPCIEIAGIRLCLSDQRFLTALQATELQRLRPFLSRCSPPASRGKTFFFETVPLADTAGPRFPAIDATLAKRSGDCFFHQNSPRFKRSLDLFREFYLPSYLARYGMKRWDTTRLLMSPNALIAYDQPAKRGVLLYRAFTSRELCEDDCILNLLRTIYITIFTHSREGIMLHASCVETGGRGYVFVGSGSSGKSTVARLIHPERVFSDDCAVIRKNAKGYCIFPNPWWNAGQEPVLRVHSKPVRLKAIFFIKKSRKTAIKRLKYKEAMAVLIYSDHLFQQWGGYNSKPGVTNFYLFAQELLAAVPAFELSVKKDGKFKDEFRDLMKEHS